MNWTYIKYTFYIAAGMWGTYRLGWLLTGLDRETASGLAVAAVFFICTAIWGDKGNRGVGSEEQGGKWDE